MNLKNLTAWFAGLITKGNAMTEVTDATIASDLAVAASSAAPAPPPIAAPAVVQAQDPAPTELEKLEELIEKLELSTVKEVKAAIGFIRALV